MVYVERVDYLSILVASVQVLWASSLRKSVNGCSLMRLLERLIEVGTFRTFGLT